MESFGKQETGVLLQEPTEEKLTTSSYSYENKEEKLSFEDFMDMIENKLTETEKKDNETNEDFLNRTKEEKKLFLESIKDEKKRNAAKVMFGAQEYVNQFNLGLEEGELPIKLKGSELQRDVANFIFENDNKEEVAELWRIYDKFFRLGGKEAESLGKGMKSAILSMVGLKKILMKNYIMDVSFTQPDIDVFYSIDMLASAKTKNSDEERLLLFQIKSLNESNVPKIKWKQFGSKDLAWMTGLDEKENNFLKGCNHFLNEKSNRLSQINKDDISALFVRLPIMQDDISSIDSMGEPNKHMESYVVQKLDESNHRLAKRNNM